MLKITLIAVGSLKERHWRAAQEEYLTRLRPMARVNLIESPSAAITASFGPDKSKQKEAKGLIKRIPKDTTVIVLDEKGKEVTSQEFAQELDKLDQETRPICFIIGGTAGLDDSVLDKADRKLSLSKMTFPHEMARIVLLEQVYRGLTIINEKIYHY
jgi:23S rRNA (pseudouridine1915-N3)-methyltransferase